MLWLLYGMLSRFGCRFLSPEMKPDTIEPLVPDTLSSFRPTLPHFQLKQELSESKRIEFKSALRLELGQTVRKVVGPE